MEHEWFSELFKQYARLISSFVYRRTAPEHVEDLTAETFATAWRKREDIQPGLELQWLYKTAGFLVANQNRKKTAIVLEEFPEVVHDADPAHIVIEDETLRSAFYKLSEKDRKVLVLAAWEGLNAQEIAEVLEISANAAAVTLSRARARFAKAFEDNAGDENAITPGSAT